MKNNVLIFSDLHINDYANYNNGKESRLMQTRTLTKLLIEAGDRYGCGRFIIAGDVTELPVMKNNVLNEVKYLLNALCDHFTDDNYIIYGQHDLSTKDNEQDPRFSGLTAILPKNLYYADKRQWVINNRMVAFMNWRPIQDLSWIISKVDLFVGHVTLAPPGAQYRGQEIDQSKFDLAITGDIHKHFNVGKMVSIGSCQQNKLGDQAESTAIVWNTDNNSWKCINIDPDRKLLRLKYTSKRQDEGFNKSDNTYYVYKPAKFVVNDTNIINIPKWSEISDLVENIIKDNGLSIVHNEVLKNVVDDESIDFNFVPVKLRLKDFRSIESAEIYFNDMDRINISGDNGAGKSSLILGLYYALKDNRSLKDFIRFGADSCECEIEFIYQGVNNKILRGSHDYGCWVNGEKLPYNNKREFEDDMYKRYPFLNYTDIFFFNADRSTILGSMSPERKSEVISKLFRIDKIDAYNSTAIRMASRIEASIESSVDELMNYTNVVTYLTDKLKNTKVPSRSVKELTRLRDKMMKLQANYIKYNESKSASDKIKGTLKFINDCVSSLTSKISAVNVTELNNKLNELAQSIESTKSIRDKIASLTTDLNVLKRDLASIMTRGSEVFNQLNKVKSNVCPTCGSRVVLKDLEQSLTTEKENSIMKLTSELAALNEKNVDSELYNLTNKYNELQSTLGALTSNKSELARLNKQAIEYTKQLSEVEEVAEVKLPEGFYDQFNEINFDLARHEEYNKLVNDLNFNKSKVDEINKKLADVKNGLSLVNKYIKLTGSTGDVYREVMTRISKDFSDDVIRYEVNQYKFRSKDHLDLDVQYNVAGRWVSYQSLSSGQKTMADINFLSRILVECGLLVFDETLKHLSQASTEYCLDLMRGMNVHAMILTTHMYGTESFANKLIDLKLDGTGLTKIDIR